MPSHPARQRSLTSSTSSPAGSSSASTPNANTTTTGHTSSHAYSSSRSPRSSRASPHQPHTAPRSHTTRPRSSAAAATSPSGNAGSHSAATPIPQQPTTAQHQQRSPSTRHAAHHDSQGTCSTRSCAAAEHPSAPSQDAQACDHAHNTDATRKRTAHPAVTEQHKHASAAQYSHETTTRANAAASTTRPARHSAPATSGRSQPKAATRRATASRTAKHATSRPIHTPAEERTIVRTSSQPTDRRGTGCFANIVFESAPPGPSLAACTGLMRRVNPGRVLRFRRVDLRA